MIEITKHHLPAITEQHFMHSVEVGDRIALARKEKGLSQAQLAEKLNVAQSTVAQWETGKNKVSIEDLERIARAVGRSKEWLAFGHDELQPSGEKQLAASAQTPIATSRTADLTYLGETRYKGERDLPIRGYVKSGELGFFYDNGDIRGYAVRPKSLVGIEDAYAVRLHSDSMAPIQPGCVLKVDPTRPPRAGDNVVIELHDGQAFFKQLVRQTERMLICEQFNPRRKIEWKPDLVKSVHVVVDISTVE